MDGSEIVTAVKSLAAGEKRQGRDLILLEFLSDCSPQLISALSVCFNGVISSGEWPDCWGEGDITLIHKKGSPTDPSNYRPITFTLYSVESIRARSSPESE